MRPGFQNPKTVPAPSCTVTRTRAVHRNPRRSLAEAERFDVGTGDVSGEGEGIKVESECFQARESCLRLNRAVWIERADAGYIARLQGSTAGRHCGNAWREGIESGALIDGQCR